MKRLTIQIIIISIAALIAACSIKKQANTEIRSHIVYVDTPRYDEKQTPYPSLSYNSNISTPEPQVIRTQEYYESAYQELEAMLQGKQQMDFERAVFVSENSFYNNTMRYEDFQKTLDKHANRIKKIIAANDKSARMDFRTLANAREKGEGYNSLRYTEQEKKELYQKALTNWAIFTYLTDTVKFSNKNHLPFKYKTDDPFGMSNWGNSQVMHLLGSVDRQGNCFALVALFKILSNRLNSEAYICTAPQHIYIQHKDAKGQFYNLELATGTYPGDGTLQTLTFTYREGIMSGISLRRLKSEKQNIALCMVNLGKSYEHKFQDKQNDYLLRCAEAALQADSLNLNGMLLQKQVFEERVVTYLKQNNIEDIAGITKRDSIYSTYLKVQEQILSLYDLGYHEMPRYMQEIVIASFRKNDQPLYVSDRTPNPFTSIDVPKKDRRYSTISGGLYEEVHEKKEFEQYGQFIINTKERTIVKFEPNCLNVLIDPVVFAWSVDPMAHMRESWTPYNAFRNNPILNIDPTGALDTKYEDEEGNELLNTNDGSDAVVTVSNDKLKQFKENIESAKTPGMMDLYNSKGWNDYWKEELIGFKLSDGQESMLHQLNSDWSRRNAIKFWQNPTIENGLTFAFSEALSQWTNPVLVAGGLSAGVSALGAASRASLLKNAANGKGNFGLGQANAAEAMSAGKQWVGSGYRIASDGKTMISSDGLRQFRPPSYKPKLQKSQANFEMRTTNKGAWESNGHLDIIE